MSAMKTIDVLGQIIRNYPGDITGENKLNIISEVCDLGLRMISVMFDIFHLVEEDLIRVIADEVKENNVNALESEVVKKVKDLFAVTLVWFTREMVSKISYAIGNEHLMIAVEEVFSNTPSLAGEIIKCQIQFNRLRKPSTDIAITSYQHANKEGNWFATMLLRSIIAEYLSFNECGYSLRDKMCSEFGLDKSNMLVAAKMNMDN